MKTISFLSFLVLFSANFGHAADSTFVLDKIELKQDQNMGHDYYYKEKKLKYLSDYYGVLVQSPNPNVMDNYLKWKKFNESDLLFVAGGTFLLVYIGAFLVPEKIYINDLWYLPVAGACLIKVGIPTTFLKYKYKGKAIIEFNKVHDRGHS
jgi:hypothetical protein